MQKRICNGCSVRVGIFNPNLTNIKDAYILHWGLANLNNYRFWDVDYWIYAPILALLQTHFQTCNKHDYQLLTDAFKYYIFEW